jgi:hypothetical protein
LRVFRDVVEIFFCEWLSDIGSTHDTHDIQ